MLLEKDEGQPRFVKKKVFVTSIFLYVEQREQSVPLIIFCSNTCVAGIRIMPPAGLINPTVTNGIPYVSLRRLSSTWP